MEKPSYAMFTEKGNQMVHSIIKTTKTWKEAEHKLKLLSDNKDFGEAYDTAVREEVYVAYYPEKNNIAV